MPEAKKNVRCDDGDVRSGSLASFWLPNPTISMSASPQKHPIMRARKCKHDGFPTASLFVKHLRQTTNLGVRSSNLFGRAIHYPNRLAPSFDATVLLPAVGRLPRRATPGLAELVRNAALAQRSNNGGRAYITTFVRAFRHRPLPKLRIIRPCASVRQAETLTQRRPQLSGRHVHKPGVLADPAAAAGKIAPQSR